MTARQIGDLSFLLTGTAALLAGAFMLWGLPGMIFAFGVWCLAGITVNQLVL